MLCSLPGSKGKATQSLQEQDMEHLRSGLKESMESPYASVEYHQKNFSHQKQSSKAKITKQNSNPQPLDNDGHFYSPHLSFQQPMPSENRERQHGLTHQLLSLSPSAESSTKILDFSCERRRSSSFSPTLLEPSCDKNLYTNSFGKNTLPPINVSLQSHVRTQETSFSNTMIAPDISSSRAQPKRLRSISTLDSFVPSIREILPLDNGSFRSSESLQDERRSSTQAEKRSTNDKNLSNIDQQRSTPIDNNINTSNLSQSKKLLLPPTNSRSTQSHGDMTNKTRRRRREMQAINMIIETREFPYNDEYIWKNNGNTIQKSTGQKSIYYKCSNSLMRESSE
ncbi:hypothetical protein [Parasitella parasitica]|uniref:WRKY domain-containing protein n=1 Tax=Parasitella parasitica TaxID=35722 RepID=A0A0B7MXH2_9FUNG|nr:hypothetical protein [Parasitella parasitica]